MGWAETGQGLMGGNLWEYRNRYIENSPIFYLDRVTTPLLLINGSQDLAPGLADETFSDLRRLGKPVEYARYQAEEHWPGSWSMANQEDYLNRVDRMVRSLFAELKSHTLAPGASRVPYSVTAIIQFPPAR